MNDELSEALRGTLKTAARNAPVPSPDLLGRVEKRHRSRRRARTGMAMAAVLAVIGGSGTVASVLGSGGQDPTRPAAQGPTRPAAQGKPGPLKPTTPAEPVPVERLWPQAVRTVPDTLPNGRSYRPIELLDDSTLLVNTESSFEKADQVLTYDLTTRRTAAVARVPVPADARIFPSDFTVGEGRVAWWIRRHSGGRIIVEIWAAPLTGGTAYRVATVDLGSGKNAGGDVRRLTLGGGKVYWSMEESGRSPSGVYEAPLTGGAARQVPGTAGYDVLAWPWIGAPRPTGFGRERTGDVYHRVLRDLRSGRTRTASLTKIPGTWTCGITWCLGVKSLPRQWSAADGPMPEPRTYLQRRDGTKGVEVRNVSFDFVEAGFLLNDRFLPFMQSAGHRSTGAAGRRALYDLETGRVADLGVHRTGGGYSAIGPADDPLRRLLTVSGKDSFTLVDLAKVS